MIEILKGWWNDIFYRGPYVPFFVNDGYFGLDKVGHFSRHVIFTTVGLLLGGAAWSILWYDTLFDIIYEYKDYCRGSGFSWLDVIYGRAGCLITLLVWQVWSAI